MILPTANWTTFATGALVATAFMTSPTAADDMQVNTFTTGAQSSAAVSLDADGDFVVVWQGSGFAGTDSSGTSSGADLFFDPLTSGPRPASAAVDTIKPPAPLVITVEGSRHAACVSRSADEGSGPGYVRRRS